MGAGRTTETNPVPSKLQSSDAPWNSSVSARNLRKCDLGSVIFGCKRHTIRECLAKNLFGLPSTHFSYVRNIEPGLLLFLFNYTDRKMSGIYEAASCGQLNIDPYAWTEDGSVKTAFPAQVRVCVKTQCQLLSEEQFKKVIKDNYYSSTHFWFELDHAQTRCLMSLFKPVPVPANAKQLPAVSIKKNLLAPLSPAQMKVPAVPEHVKKDSKNLKDLNRFSLLRDSDSKVLDGWEDWDVENSSSCKIPTSFVDEGDIKELVPTLENWEDDTARDDIWSDKISNPGGDGPSVLCEGVPVEELDSVEPDQLISCSQLDGDSRCMPEKGSDSETDESLQKDHSGVGPYADRESEKNFTDECCKHDILQKLKALAVKRDQSILTSKTFVDDNSGLHISKDVQVQVRTPEELVGSNVVEEKVSTYDQYPGCAELQIISELVQKNRALEMKQSKSDEEVQRLRALVEDSERKIGVLCSEIEKLNLKLNSVSLAGGSYSNVARQSAGGEAIYLIGGYNGSTWLSNLDLFSPTMDRVESLKPMSSARSYASTAALNGNIFVFGGGDGGINSWYHTVECYNPRIDEWTMCAPLSLAKGILAGTTVNNKIFAIGGGDGHQCFSEVEMFDPVLEKWIYSQPMLQKRFALSATELHGVIYAVGGYDGHSYLNTTERYDPREGYWAMLPSMNTRRGCHSMAVLNEMLYVMGGYDGEKMVPSVEIFDPRLGSWTVGEPLSSPRGYAAAVTLGDTLCVIGGTKQQMQFVDFMVECYKSGSGWTTSPGFGSSIQERCYFSAITLQGDI